MSFLSALYTLIISPLELFFEVIFTIANRLIGNAGLSIIFLSLAVNFLVLPLYKRADELQAEERDIQAKMAYRIKRTKETFKGDERFMMLQEYYRINNYKPIYALRSSFSLLLQIPFFIAAYNLLSGMQSLQGMPFGFISDLGKEDAMFMIGSFPVNILPILMTLINVVSGIIYTKGHPVKEKVQVYGLAAVFLVLLYRSPSGLVFYWLLNNVFSLVKNVFYKLKDPKKVLSIVLAIAGLGLLIPTLIRTDLDARQKFLLALGCVLLALPLMSGLLKGKIKANDKPAVKNRGVFIAGAILLALLTGFFIPTTVINASPLEFIDATNPSNPAVYILNSVLLSTGSFVLWGGVFYFFVSDKMKSLFSQMIWIICGVSVIDYMLFGTKLGILSSTLQFETTPVFTASDYLINILAVSAVAALFRFIYKKIQSIAKPVLLIGILTVIGIGAISLAEILGTFTWYNVFTEPSTEIPEIRLSQNGQNVIVLMLDRARASQLPYAINEKPELKEQFDGFTYYPNTISYGAFTNIGTPPLFGGYEYTPERMNERSEESLADKHNEALKVMPEIFGNNGYEVTICDPPYAGYAWVPDLSIYDDHPEFNCYRIRGRFSLFEDGDNSASSLEMAKRTDEIRNRNFFCYSLMKVSPVLIQETLYDGGLYNKSSSGSSSDTVLIPSVVQHMDGLSRSTGYDRSFIETFPVLMNLPNITTVSDSDQNTFLMMVNDTPHAPMLLQEPDYLPSLEVDNTAYDVDMVSRYTVNGVTMPMENEEQVTYYHAYIASLIQLGKWFDYLRENGVYDNTRIIIVADHGRDLFQFGDICNGEDMEFFTPLLMVKDFDATGFTISDEFMTNGDVPTLATSGIIENPENPFTHNPIDSSLKDGPQTVLLSYDWDVATNNGNTYLPGSWYRVDGNPHDPANWEYLGDW